MEDVQGRCRRRGLDATVADRSTFGRGRATAPLTLPSPCVRLWPGRGCARPSESVSRHSLPYSLSPRSYLLLVASLLALGGCTGGAAPDGESSADGPKAVQTAQAVPQTHESFTYLGRQHEKHGALYWPVAATLARVSYIAYSDPDQQATDLKGIGATTVQSVDKGSSHGVVASNDSTVVIAFRGTKDPGDWLTDAKIVRERVANGGIHRGFYNAVADIYDEVYAEAMRQGAADKAVWITGHSLGGAMAVVFAYRAMSEKQLMADGVVTFGQPLAFTTPLAQTMLEKYGGRYIRFVNEWDPVTRLIPTYRHAGVRIHLDSDTYTVRKPMLSFELHAGGNVPQNSEEEDLAPMSEDEYEDFLNVVVDEQGRAGVPSAQLSIGGIPLFKPHLMGTYIDHLQEIVSEPAAVARPQQKVESRE